MDVLNEVGDMFDELQDTKWVGCIYRTSLQACPMTELCPVIDLTAITKVNIYRNHWYSIMDYDDKRLIKVRDHFLEYLPRIRKVNEDCPLRKLMK